jgi:hypothetical protein
MISRSSEIEALEGDNGLHTAAVKKLCVAKRSDGVLSCCICLAVKLFCLLERWGHTIVAVKRNQMNIAELDHGSNITLRSRLLDPVDTHRSI